MSIYDYLKAYTASALRISALNKVTANVDKREGSVIFDTISPLSVVAANIIDMMRIALENTNLQTAGGQWLDLIGQQPPCGVYRKQAVKAIKKAIATPSGVYVATNTRFKSNDGLGLFWRITSALGDDAYLLTCETAGAAGGGDYGELTPDSSVQGLDLLVFADEPAFNDGEDEESDDEFRLRIWDALKTNAYGGNFADYQHWVLNEIKTQSGEPSFDGMIFFPSTRYTGGGNIKIFPTQTDVIGRKYMPANQTACEALKSYLDPISASGLGAGVSPVGHRVEVASPGSDLWDLKISVVLKQGYDIDDYYDDAFDRVGSYFEIIRSNLVSKINDEFPMASGSTSGYIETITANNIIGYLIPEIECFESVESVKRKINGIYVDVNNTTYNPTFSNSLLPSISNITFEVVTDE